MLVLCNALAGVLTEEHQLCGSLDVAVTHRHAVTCLKRAVTKLLHLLVSSAAIVAFHNFIPSLKSSTTDYEIEQHCRSISRLKWLSMVYMLMKLQSQVCTAQSTKLSLLAKNRLRY